jgi:hypothetical protein
METKTFDVVSEDRIELCADAMFSCGFPCNPIPFALALASYVGKKGSDSIKDDTAKRILWILMAQSYGQLSRIDLSDEWDRLNKIKGEK